ncbi:MAG: VOC family protein [Dehalococcoidia bacterium]|nr:VOC family protein [Dehalococcoidia bacterium]
MSVAFGSTAILSVNVKDVAKAVEWYTTKLGFGVNVFFEDLPWADIATNVPGFSIGLSQAPELAGKSACAVTLAMDDVHASRAALEALGVTFQEENTVIPGKVILAHFSDLDGNPLALAQSLM